MLRREIKRVKRRESDAWRKRLRYEVSNIDDENIVCVCVCVCIDLMLVKKQTQEGLV